MDLLSCSQGFSTTHESSYVFNVVTVVSFSVVVVARDVVVIVVGKLMRAVRDVGATVEVGSFVVGVVVSLYS